MMGEDLPFSKAAEAAILGDDVFLLREEDVDAFVRQGASLIFERMKREGEIPQSLDFAQTMAYITAVHNGTNADERDYPVDASLEDIISGYAACVEQQPDDRPAVTL